MQLPPCRDRGDFHSCPSHWLSTKLASSCLVGTEVAPGIVLTGPRIDGASTRRDTQQLFWYRGKEFVCEGISFPGKEMHTPKAHCQQILISTRGKKGCFHSDLRVGREESKHPLQEGSLGRVSLCCVVVTRPMGLQLRSETEDYSSGEPSPDSHLYHQKAQ